MARITADNGDPIDYREYGDPGGRPVVLLAGFTAPATSWRYQLPALANAGHRVLAVDLPGHGTTGALPPGFTMRSRAAAVRVLLEELDLRDAVLVGGSMGGNTIWAYATTFGTDRLGAAVVIDQTPKMLNSPDWAHGFYGYDRSNADTYFAEGVPSTGHGTPFWRRGMRLVRLLRTVRGGRRAFTPEELALLDDHAKRDWRDTIAGTAVPVQFIAGAESEFWPATHAHAAAALAPRGTAVVVARAGHGTNVEQPRAVNRELLRFLAGPAHS
ncbi:alpha/beta hydrolase [Amycolatopsis antarctica]|uniref:Alpha/beta hydrolase n=1 Tax=Amycolatopsis antarctica TaxID=1854586 RepID=A0A263DBP7_9PSEU|nr:alpha/beta hydrolase [Amycolatopsis antarctica]OZM74815.1 alpha/beta hydrolase [Amycolatopsis antarctica]